ncbi:MAG TPA: DUF2306 domain-containing protein [Candidatus Acidoferrales bacterium]|nr:DUF2306 domain-containing protein [Candidatus Acidoferrales bacterium]
MATATAPAAVTRKRSFQAKHAMWFVFGLMTLFVLLTRDRMLLDANSPLRQRYAAIPWLMLAHGIPGALALCLGVFQFSNRIRQRFLNVHRWMGRTYVACVAVAAPVAIAVAVALPIPTLLMASVVQASGWLITTATALYCIRTGRIQQHREWMMRSYPFAMVFVVVRVIIAIPPIAAMGLEGLENTVWSVIAAACFLPSAVIAWQSLAASRPAAKVRMIAAD